METAVTKRLPHEERRGAAILPCTMPLDASSETSSQPEPPHFCARIANAAPFAPAQQYFGTLLLMTAVMLSRVIGYVREPIFLGFWRWATHRCLRRWFHHSRFPELHCRGGAASITFISIYNAFLRRKREEEAEKTSPSHHRDDDRTGLGVVLAEIYTPQVLRLVVPKFDAEQMRCAYISRVFSSRHRSSSTSRVVRLCCFPALFLFPAFGPLLKRLHYSGASYWENSSEFLLLPTCLGRSFHRSFSD